MDVIALRARMLREWRSWIESLVEAIAKELPDARIYVIGSVAEGGAIGASDLDLLVVTENAPRDPRSRAELITRIEERAKLPLYHPIEFHIVDLGEGVNTWRNVLER